MPQPQERPWSKTTPPRSPLELLALQRLAGNGAATRAATRARDAGQQLEVQRRLGLGLATDTDVVHHDETSDEEGFKVERWSPKLSSYTLRTGAGDAIPKISPDDVSWGTKANQAESRRTWETSRGSGAGRGIASGPFDYGLLVPTPDLPRNDYRYWVYYMLHQIRSVERKKHFLERIFEPDESRTVRSTLDTDEKKRKILNEIFQEGFVSYEELAKQKNKELVKPGAQLANSIQGETTFGYGFRGDNRDPATMMAAGGFTTKADARNVPFRESMGLNADWNPFKFQTELPGQNLAKNAGYFRKGDEDNDLTTIISVTPNFIDATKFPFIQEYKQGSMMVDVGGGIQRRQSKTYVYLVLVEQGFDTKTAQGGNAFPEIATRTVPWSNIAAVYEIKRLHCGEDANDGHEASLLSFQVLDGARARYGGTPAWSTIMQAVEGYASMGPIVYKPQEETPKVKTLPFRVRYSTRPGQDLFVVGSIPELGVWNPDQARPLRWVDQNLWEGEVAVPPNSPVHAKRTFEYKFLVKEAGGVQWEGGANHLYDTSVRRPASAPDAWH